MELRANQQEQHDPQGLRTWHIPPKHVFVRGDNTRGSIDSLVWGPIPVRSIQGIVLRKLPRQTEFEKDTDNLNEVVST